MTTVTIADTSPYKDTRVHRIDGIVGFGLWRSDASLRQAENCFLYTVTEPDVGRLDRLAYLMYGDVDLWWVIAHANDWINPLTDMKAGATIKVPKLDAVQRYKVRRAALA